MSANQRNTEMNEESPLLPRVASVAPLISSASDSASSVEGSATQSRNENAPLLADRVDEVKPQPESSKILSSLKVEEEEGYWAGFMRILTKGPNKKTNKKWVWYYAWTDVASNLHEIFIRDRDTDLNVLDGVRALAYLWVLDDHLYQVCTVEVDGFIIWFKDAGGLVTILAGNKGDQGVTSFFVLSGFLILFILTRLKKSRKEENLTFGTALEFLFRRYVRLAPSIYVSTCIVILYGYLNPDNKKINITFFQSCKKYWWQNFVFLNNYSSMMGMDNCYDSVWTISVEMQLYLLTIPVAYFYILDPQYGFFAALIWTAACVIIRTALCYWMDETGNKGYGTYVYTAAYTRADAYGLGMILYMVWDHYLSDKKKRLALALERPTAYSTTLKIAFWVCLFGCISLGIFYLVSGQGWWIFSTYQYYSFSFLLWSATLSCIIYLALDGTLWPITYILGWDVWYPIGSLAYTGGLLNIIVCYMYTTWLNETTEDTFTWDGDFWDYTYLYLQVLLTSMAIGLCLSLLIERPFMQLGKRVKFK